jgi:5-methylcytosine-specific restriction protein A
MSAAKLIETPLCEDCAQIGITRLASQVDHVVAVAVAPERAYDPDNLRSLCASHHSEKTRRVDDARGRKRKRFRKGADLAGNPIDPDDPWNK